MIIPALCRYYDILDADVNIPISKDGYSIAKVSFALVLSPEGELTNIVDLRTDEKKPRPKDLEVPKQETRSSGISPYFLCDNAKNLFGVEKKAKKEREKVIEDTSNLISVLSDDGNEAVVVLKGSKDRYEALKDLHHRILKDSTGPEVNALLKFLDSWDPKSFLSHPKLLQYADDLLEGGNCVFEFLDKPGTYLHSIPLFRKAWERENQQGEEDEYVAQCLVTGETLPISRKHQMIKGVAGAQITGASLVSFNDPCFESYGKKQSYNAPISALAEFKYTTVLKYLIANRSNKIRIGDSTSVFWAETTEKAGDDLAMYLFNPYDDEEEKEESPEGTRVQDVKTRELVRDILAKVKAGNPLSTQDLGTDPETKFYILGLSPNNARLSVRFWHIDQFGNFVTTLARHHLDLEIVRDDSGPPYISVYRLLKETVPKMSDKAEPSPIIGGLLMAAILNNSIYPVQLYHAILNRVKAERSINYVRAAFMKAYLLRMSRAGHSKIPEEMITVSLQENNQNVPYRLGRLFAALEKVQGETNKDMGSTINSKYFSSASATPAVVFPVLLKLAQHHIAKSEWGFKTTQLIEEVLSGVDSFPAFLSLEDQGMFMLGYYHQWKAFFVKKDTMAVNEG